MGYPMDYMRVVNRNGLEGDYEYASDGPMQVLNSIAGDLRRLEDDTRDAWHLSLYADFAGVSNKQVKMIFDEFFSGNIEMHIPKRKGFFRKLLSKIWS